MPLAGASPAIYQNTTLSDLGDSRLVLLIFWTLVHELSTASLLALGLIGLAAKRRRSNYSSPSPAWSANASAGGGHVRISVPLRATASLRTARSASCNAFVWWLPQSKAETTLG
jgi:hypothetical protein